METIMQEFKELEKMIVKNNIYHRCRHYNPECIQCDFWKRFDLLKKDIMEGL